MMTQNKMVLPGIQRQKEGKILQEVRKDCGEKIDIGDFMHQPI
jgi:hypothetical protein